MLKGLQVSQSHSPTLQQLSEQLSFKLPSASCHQHAAHQQFPSCFAEHWTDSPDAHLNEDCVCPRTRFLPTEARRIQTTGSISSNLTHGWLQASAALYALILASMSLAPAGWRYSRVDTYFTKRVCSRALNTGKPVRTVE